MDATTESPGDRPESGDQWGRGRLGGDAREGNGLTWETVGGLSDDALERTLYGPKLALTVARPGPDLVWMHTELRRPGPDSDVRAYP